ncbi:MAG: permease [Armatimonadota bacterium]
MNSADDRINTDADGRTGNWRLAVFPLAVMLAYVILYLIMPARTGRALVASGQILVQVALPLCIAFVLMVVLNLFVKPAHVSRFLGTGAGLRGVAISTLGGMISTGPIYAWYPLLKDLRERGASNFHIANFLGNRAVKPFLLPVMVFYFGWGYTVVLNILLIVGAISIACIVSLLVGWREVRE